MPVIGDMPAIQQGLAPEAYTPVRTVSTGVDLSAVLVWALAAVLILPLILAAERSNRNERSVDFNVFYAASRIAADSPAKIYDSRIQKAEMGTYFSYPPFVALLLRPVCSIPFWTAYRVYQTLSAGLYVIGLLWLRRVFLRGSPVAYLILPLSLACQAFIACTWMNGQFSVFGFASLALALVCLESRRLFLCGLCLALCAYKPPLLLLLLPMLLFRKQFRVLAGFACGFAALTCAATLAYGWRIWSSYYHFAQQISGEVMSHRPLLRYADLSAFASILHVPQGVSMFGFIALPLIIAAWRNYDSNPRLAWASSITWTMILSPYTPIYDTIMVIPALIASASALGKSAIWAMWLFFACSWISEALAVSIHIQVLTIAILAIGILQIATLRRSPCGGYKHKSPARD